MILPFRNLAVRPLRHRAATCTIWTWPPAANRSPPLLLPQRNHQLPAAAAAAAEATRVPAHPRAVHNHHPPPRRKGHPKPILLHCPYGAVFLPRYQIEAPGHRPCRRDPTSKICYTHTLYVVIIEKIKEVYQAENLITSRIKCRGLIIQKQTKKHNYSREQYAKHYPNHTDCACMLHVELRHC